MKLYRVTKHAVERTVERLGISAEYASNHLIQLMQTAYYNGSTPHPSGKMTKVFDHYKTRTRIIVDDNDSIVTVYKVPEEPMNIIPEILRPLISKEFRKLSREVTRNTRLLEKEIAELTVQMGERMVAKANAKNPNTRAIIQRDIDEVVATIGIKQAEITQEIDRLDIFKHAAGVIV